MTDGDKPEVHSSMAVGPIPQQMIDDGLPPPSPTVMDKGRSNDDGELPGCAQVC